MKPLTLTQCSVPSLDGELAWVKQKNLAPLPFGPAHTPPSVVACRLGKFQYKTLNMYVLADPLVFPLTPHTQC